MRLRVFHDRPSPLICLPTSFIPPASSAHTPPLAFAISVMSRGRLPLLALIASTWTLWSSLICPPQPVSGALSSGPSGHVLSSSLQVFGNVTLVDSAGTTKNLLDIIQRQEALLAQQSASLAQLSSSCITGVNMVHFDSSGSYTPPSNVLSVTVELVGGGGGGGNAPAISGGTSLGGGGGGGGYSQRTLTAAQLGTGPIAVTVGFGGASADSGGSSNFGGFLSATGGAPGVSPTGGDNAYAFGGGGGVGSGGDLNIQGGDGGAGKGVSIYGFSGYGGSAQWGGSVQGAIVNGGTNPGGNGLSYGGGGGGAGTANAAATGGVGAAGRVIIREFLRS